MKIYIAGPWLHRGDMPSIAAQFEAEGHTVTWKWWETDDIAEGSNREAELEAQARHDVAGVREAQALVLINSAKSEGKSFESGVAFERKTPIICVGKRGAVSTNVFHYMPEFKWVETIQGAINALKG